MDKKVDIKLTFLGSDVSTIEAVLLQHGFKDQAETLIIQSENQGVRACCCDTCECGEDEKIKAILEGFENKQLIDKPIFSESPTCAKGDKSYMNNDVTDGNINP